MHKMQCRDIQNRQIRDQDPNPALGFRTKRIVLAVRKLLPNLLGRNTCQESAKICRCAKSRQRPQQIAEFPKEHHKLATIQMCFFIFIQDKIRPVFSSVQFEQIKNYKNSKPVKAKPSAGFLKVTSSHTNQIFIHIAKSQKTVLEKDWKKETESIITFEIWHLELDC